jgi:uncharacterized protein (TIGR02271 family)
VVCNRINIKKLINTSGIIVMICGVFLDSYGGEDMSEKVTYSDEHKLQLHEEKLDISKKWIQTREVKIHKEIITTEKTVTVPVNRVELVIENVNLNEESSDKAEIIRIPISEESIEVIKKPAILEEVAYYIKQYCDIKPITETLKKEKLNIETSGAVTVLEKEMVDSSDIANS